MWRHKERLRGLIWWELTTQSYLYSWLRTHPHSCSCNQGRAGKRKRADPRLGQCSKLEGGIGLWEKENSWENKWENVSEARPPEGGIVTQVRTCPALSKGFDWNVYSTETNITISLEKWNHNLCFLVKLREDCWTDNFYGKSRTSLWEWWKMLTC